VSGSYDEIRQADASNSSVSSRANIDIASGMSAAEESARVDSITAMRSSNRRELSERGRILLEISTPGGVRHTPDRVTTWRGRAVCDAFCAAPGPTSARPGRAGLRRPPLPPDRLRRQLRGSHPRVAAPALELILA